MLELMKFYFTNISTNFRGLGTLRFSATIQKVGDVCDLVCSPAHESSFDRQSTLKGNNLGSKLFPFRVNSFSEGRKNYFERVTCPESVSVLLKFHLPGVLY